MQISDWINVVLNIFSFILAVISVITVIVTLKQNNKMIENSTRPYIKIYAQLTNFNNQSYYLILKNSGQTSAIITQLKSDIDLSKYSYINGKNVFNRIEGTSLVPGQSIITTLNLNGLKEDDIEKYSFDIEYSSGVKKYKEKYTINHLIYTDMVQKRFEREGENDKIIAYTLQDMVERML